MTELFWAINRMQYRLYIIRKAVPAEFKLIACIYIGFLMAAHYEGYAVMSTGTPYSVTYLLMYSLCVFMIYTIIINSTSLVLRKISRFIANSFRKDLAECKNRNNMGD